MFKKKTYKQRLIDLLTEEFRLQTDRYNKTRLQTYIKQVNALPAIVFTPKKFRHQLVNSIYLFNPKLINKLYGIDN
jgi:hypothetical protein